jgi:hypothetical protein
MAELVNHGANGLLFRRGDASDLARWMTRAVQEKGLWERLAAALPRVPTTVESTARHLVVYSSLLGASHQRSA